MKSSPKGGTERPHVQRSMRKRQRNEKKYYSMQTKKNAPLLRLADISTSLQINFQSGVGSVYCAVQYAIKKPCLIATAV